MPINLIQKMLGNKPSLPSEQYTQISHTIQLPREKIWFDMYLTKDGKQIDSTIRHEEKEYPRIDAGKTYRLVALGSNIPSDFHANNMGLEFSTEIKVRLQCIANTEIIIEEERTITSTEANSYRQEFTLNIGSSMPTCELIMRMDVIVAEDATRTIGTKKLFIRGTFELIPQSFLHRCQIATCPPHNVSILSIFPHQSLHYQLGITIEGRNAGQNLPTLRYENQEQVSIQQYIQAGIEPLSIRAKIRKFSQFLRNHGDQKLFTWLTWLEETYKEDCYLIIEDESALEIPWEMIELQDDYHYLGAAIKVVRWISTETQNINMGLEVNSYLHQGSVLSYLDSNLKEEDTAAEKMMLQQLKIDECSNLNILKKRFKTTGSLADIGLIYIGCHGQDGNSLYLANQKVLTAEKLAVMSKHTYPRPLAFFNACESARLGKIGTFDNSSFVTTLLERIVQGYIGTLATVGSLEASTIAHNFLSIAYNNPDMPIAAILQRIRREAAQKLMQGYETWSDDDPEEMAIELTFLYTFLYVYYGNPLARLQLAPRTAAIHDPQQIEESSCNN